MTSLRILTPAFQAAKRALDRFLNGPPDEEVRVRRAFDTASYFPHTALRTPWENAPGKVGERPLVIAGIVWLVRLVTAGGAGAAERSRAKAILEERFARGEISEEEFRRMRAELR